ncbi:copper resistance protein NlpE [Shewanella eurypsychrophilus]|uniref:Copper resistance protein NlpE n=1 Tax=Shewanella eurypsychrophilus TaxID=2593656 RepID=A0ABX6VBX7_9GAMM|nr:MULTISPECIES: copper resistance protein NlpE [Shewanella]QFU24199.1 copper resistance protein NlpE [Shewanella sp. YLB-09]QPG59404.1 copper resistance protein NlpE [Shewanella eurypsychrophilus]
MKFQLIAISLIAFSISACSKQDTTAEQTPAAKAEVARTLAQVEQLPVGDTSRTSLDWNGTYSGVIPCASCEGISTVLTLELDNSYVLETSYLGEAEPGQKTKVFAESGSFEWNKTGNTISLMGDASRQSPQQFQVGENQLFMLDNEGKRITGSLANNYRLAKQD